MFKRKQLADGVFFNVVTDKRFKVNQIAVFIASDFDEAPRADLAEAAYILTDCSGKFPSYREMSLKLSNMYDASLSSNTTFIHVGNCRFVYVGGVVLDDRYALNGEPLEREYCSLICDCLLHPNAQNGAFDETAAELMRGELIDTIDSVINDKSAYAAQNANRTAFVGEEIELPVYGTHEEAERVTAKSAYAAYKRMLEHGHFEITASGCSDFAEAERIFTEFARELSETAERRDICEVKCTPSPLKAQPVYASDTMPMQQAILRMVFKAPELTDNYANKLFTMILGGMSTSRFFTNIREKQSLCYYCSCGSNRHKRVLTVHSGVEPANLKRVEEAVLAELDRLCSDGITDEELSAAVLEVENRIASMRDTPAVAGWYLDQITDERILRPEEYLERIKQVTPERIVAAARQYKLDTVYSLSGEVDE